MERVSVAMTVCNSEKFLRQQLESIMRELTDKDELIISDDGSADSTMSIIAEMKDPRIRAVVNMPEHNGIIQNIQNAIELCRNEIIILCDHDDVWLPGRVRRVREVLESDRNATVVVCNAELINENNRVIHSSFYELRRSRPGAIKNFVRNSYIGCCMAFRSSLLPLIMPISKRVSMHDAWIGILNDIFYKSVFISDVLVQYRRYDNNFSKLCRAPLKRVIWWRVVLGFELLKRVMKLFLINLAGARR